MTALKTPESLTEEHRELFHKLGKLAGEKGETAREVKELLTVLEPHFEREEEAAMPLLGALRPLSEGKVVRDPSEVSSLHRKFTSEYPEMLEEHNQVKRLIDDVRNAAKKAQDVNALTMMDELEHHAAVEEEVLYPAAMLVGAMASVGAKVRAQ